MGRMKIEIIMWLTLNRRLCLSLYSRTGTFMKSPMNNL